VAIVSAPFRGGSVQLSLPASRYAASWSGHRLIEGWCWGGARVGRIDLDLLRSRAPYQAPAPYAGRWPPKREVSTAVTVRSGGSGGAPRAPTSVLQTCCVSVRRPAAREVGPASVRVRIAGGLLLVADQDRNLTLR